jgi:pyruvate/2-oxoacid:ferredoxin oxidoreductase beta subunit
MSEAPTQRSGSTESVFYRTFERHNHAEGLKDHSTHYCPGCGHGLIHKYLGEAIDRLGLQDRTVAVSPVGCAVFMYYYLDVGNTQAAHGRAPAVAIGHKMANPDSIVVSYQSATRGTGTWPRSAWPRSSRPPRWACRSRWSSSTTRSTA